MRLTTLFFTFILIIAPATKAAGDNLELLNSTLVAKLHLDQNPRSSQMVGAYQIRFRNTAAAPIESVKILLNPSLNIVKVIGAGNRQLSTGNTGMVTVGGMELLELNAAQIKLAKPLSKNDSAEIVIHYRGYLEDIGWTGLKGAKETLDPHFTMIRAESFGYPVFAAPEINAIKKAWAHKPFHQVASIEYNGSGVAVSNLTVDSRRIDGNKTVADLKTDSPAPLMTVAIGSYTTESYGPVSVSTLAGNTNSQRVGTLFANAVQDFTHKLGQSGSHTLKVIEVSSGYVTGTSSDAIIMESDFFAAPSLTPEHTARLITLWKFNKSDRTGHWGAGLDAILQKSLLSSATSDAERTRYFSEVKQLFAANKILGKTALADYIIEGFSHESDAVNALAFSVLYDLMGQDAFFALARSIRTSLGSGYADMEALAKQLQKDIKNKKARQFAKNWLSSSKSGKDMVKVDTYEALLQRYK